jgi:hypothetical protein
MTPSEIAEFLHWHLSKHGSITRADVDNLDELLLEYGKERDQAIRQHAERGSTQIDLPL